MPETKQFNTRLSEELKDKLKEKSLELDRSMAWCVKKAIKQFCEK